MELYYIGLHQVEQQMKNQFEMPEGPRRPERPETRRQRPTAAEKARLAIGGALYRLAEMIDPATPVPSRQH
jgi:hypothetical protein